MNALYFVLLGLKYVLCSMHQHTNKQTSLLAELLLPAELLQTMLCFFLWSLVHSQAALPSGPAVSC